MEPIKIKKRARTIPFGFKQSSDPNYLEPIKDEFVLIILSAPIVVLAWAVISDDPEAMDKVKLFFEYFSTLPSWFTNLWILVVASIFGIKGTQIFRNGGGKK